MITRNEFITGMAGTIAAASAVIPAVAIAEEAKQSDTSWFDNPVDHTADGEIFYAEKDYKTFGGGADKVYVITGGARGIGKASARRFLKKGHVILFDIIKDRLLETQEEFMHEASYSVTAMHGDVRNPDHVRALAELAASIGKLGGIVNAAGICAIQGSAKDVYEIDLVGLAQVCEAFKDQCVPGTVVVNIGSNSDIWVPENEETVALVENPLAPDFVEKACAYVDNDAMNSYYYAKLGVKILTRRQALDWGKRGGRMVTVCPGLTDTEMGRLVIATYDIMAWAFDPEQASVPRWGTAEDMANMVEFLASDAAGWCSGDTYVVDGGQQIPNLL